jgi:hypothetical protein
MTKITKITQTNFEIMEALGSLHTDLTEYVQSFYGRIDQEAYDEDPIYWDAEMLYQDMFPNPEGLPGATEHEISIAAAQFIGAAHQADEDDYGIDTIAREITRDIMLYNRGKDLIHLEHGQWIERHIEGKVLTRARIKEYWAVLYQEWESEITPEVIARWDNRLDDLGITD